LNIENASVLAHLIFSTKDRFPFLKEPELKNDRLRTLSEFVDCLLPANPGRCPGLEFAKAFGVGE
jgi:hypothetical protein